MHVLTFVAGALIIVGGMIAFQTYTPDGTMAVFSNPGVLLTALAFVGAGLLLMLIVRAFAARKATGSNYDPDE